MAGFAKAGIFPFNRHIFQESDYIMLSVTDRPDPNKAATPIVEPPRASSSQENSTEEDPEEKGLEEEDHEEGLSPVVEKEPVSKKTPGFTPPSVFKGYPKAQPKNPNKKPRRKERCRIATDTPERDEIANREREQKGKQEEKQKKAEQRKSKHAEKQSGELAKKKKKTAPRKTVKMVKKRLKMTRALLMKMNHCHFLIKWVLKSRMKRRHQEKNQRKGTVALLQGRRRKVQPKML